MFMSRSFQLSKSDTDHLVEIIAAQAANALGMGGPQGYFNDLVSRTNLKQNFKWQLAGVWGGNPLVDARKLINWALAKPVNPEDPRYTTLGSFLTEILEEVDLTDQRWIASLIIANDLYLAPDLKNQLKAAYNIPERSTAPKQGVAEAGPDFDWWGPNDEVELQSWLQPEPEYEDVGMWMKVIERAASVCRIQFSHMERRGTGFLIARDLVLTNYHVLKEAPGEDLVENAKKAVLYFGKVSLGNGNEAEGKGFRLMAADPVPASSSVDQLDYALLRVEERIKSEKSVQPSPFSIELPVLKGALNILQHPMGKELKLARSNNGVTAIREDLGRIQYYTMAEGGSSGSPCYNKNWEVVALHHAERSSGFGVRREGILFKTIHEQIKTFL
jgi:V8-like Glu-specific endopeptidase